MGEFDPNGVAVVGAATRDTCPVPTDFGLVTRPLFCEPVPIISQESYLHLGEEFAVTNAVAVQLLLASPVGIPREGVIIQNTGTANVRIGPPGVTTTTGIRLVPNGTLTSADLEIQNAMFAIAEAAPSIVFAAEMLFTP